MIERISAPSIEAVVRVAKRLEPTAEDFDRGQHVVEHFRRQLALDVSAASQGLVKLNGTLLEDGYTFQQGSILVQPSSPIMRTLQARRYDARDFYVEARKRSAVPFVLDSLWLNPGLEAEGDELPVVGYSPEVDVVNREGLFIQRYMYGFDLGRHAVAAVHRELN